MMGNQLSLSLENEQRIYKKITNKTERRCLRKKSHHLRKLTETCGFVRSDVRTVAGITSAAVIARCVDAGVAGNVEPSTLVNVYNDQSSLPLIMCTTSASLQPRLAFCAHRGLRIVLAPPCRISSIHPALQPLAT